MPVCYWSANKVVFLINQKKEVGTLKIGFLFVNKQTLTVGGVPAMKKRTYRTKNVNKINWTQVKECLSGL